jgi:hypothetical protein
MGDPTFLHGRSSHVPVEIGEDNGSVFLPGTHTTIRRIRKTASLSEGAERSGALGGFAESCACGLSWHNRPEEGETKLDFCVSSRSGCEYIKEHANRYRSECE